jgi:glutaryl-CoA dehydrogenase
METTAEEVDGGFILRGSKTWITNAPVAYVTFFWREFTNQSGTTQ